MEPQQQATNCPMTPEQAWADIREGNQRFVAGLSQYPHQDSARRVEVQGGQNPHVVVLACSDSRVPVEIIFDQGLGDVFVIRTAGQITDLSVLASLEFAVAGLGVPLVLVLGHEGCGAVKAANEALRGGELPAGFQRALVEKVAPSILSARSQGRETPEQFESHHATQIMDQLIERSPQLQQRLNKGLCAVVAARYQLSDNCVRVLHTKGLTQDHINNRQ